MEHEKCKKVDFTVSDIGNSFSYNDLDIYRKSNYWRGFKACMWLVVLPMVGLAVGVVLFIIKWMN